MTALNPGKRTNKPLGYMLLWVQVQDLGFLDSKSIESWRICRGCAAERTPGEMRSANDTTIWTPTCKYTYIHIYIHICIRMAHWASGRLCYVYLRDYIHSRSRGEAARSALRTRGGKQKERNQSNAQKQQGSCL